MFHPHHEEPEMPEYAAFVLATIALCVLILFL